MKDEENVSSKNSIVRIGRTRLRSAEFIIENNWRFWSTNSATPETWTDLQFRTRHQEPEAKKKKAFL